MDQLGSRVNGRRAKKVRGQKAAEKARRELRRDGLQKVDGLAEARAVLSRALIPSRLRIDDRIEEARAFERWRVRPSPMEVGSSLALDDSGEWQGAMIRDLTGSLVFEHALFPVMSAAENLTTVVAAIDEWDATGATRSVSVVLMCRAVMEAAARTIWLLASEERDERRARALRVAKDEVLRQKKFAEAMLGNGDTEAETNQHEAETVDTCKKILDELDSSGVNGGWKMEQMIEYAAIWVDDNSVNRSNKPMASHIRAMYSITSGVAHGHTWPTRYLSGPTSLFNVIADCLYSTVTLLGAAVILYEAQASASGNIGSRCPANLRDAAAQMFPRYSVAA